MTLNSKNITVDIVGPADVPNDRLCTDFRIFEGIVYHLFANAVKYSDSSQTINVEITFRGPQSKELLLETLQVTITNRGVGSVEPKWCSKKF